MRLRHIARFRGQDGQSLVEFAIIAPVIVGILVFAIFFYEATQIKLKQQEAERFVAWEFTGYQLSDYGKGGNQSQLYNEARSAIISEMRDRYANLVSTNKEANQSSYLMTEWQISDPRVTHSTAPDLPGGFWVNLVFNIFKILYAVWDMQSYTSPNLYQMQLMAGSETQPGFMGSGGIAAQFDAADRWKFNTKGYIKTKMTWTIRPTIFFARNFMDARFDNHRFRDWTSLTLDDKSAKDGIALIVDHWDLRDGRAVGGNFPSAGQDHSTPYWKQMDRMAFVTPASKGIAQGAANTLTSALSLITMLCLQVPMSASPTETVLSSKAYSGSGGTAGKRTLQVDGGESQFDTAPYVGAYKSAGEQRGEYFMGCKEDEKLGCNRSLSSNNPFGEFIITEGGSP